MIFDNLKDFYRFLLDNHLDDLVTQNIQLLQKANLPLLQYFKHLSKEDFYSLTKESLSKYLRGIIEGRGLSDAQENIDNWKNNKIKEFKRTHVTSTDVVQVYSIRKQVFINFICAYTDDNSIIISVIKELEAFHSFVEKYAIDALLSISNEELNATIQQLKNTQENLNSTNIVLKEHKEELQALNEELATTNEELTASNDELQSSNEELNVLNKEHLKYIAQIEKIQEELQMSRNYYLTLLEDFPALIWRANAKAKFDYFNTTWLNFTGRTFDQEFGDGWVEGVHPEDVNRCLNIFISNFKERKPFEMLYRLKRYDGKYRYLLDYGKPIYNVENEFTGFLGACFDITEQKELSEALTASNKQLMESNIALEKTQTLLQISYSQLEEKVLQRTKALNVAKDEITSLLISEKEAHDEVNRRKNELKLINSELKEKNRELLKINIDLDNFIYTASHDLKAPVTNIEGLMTLLNSQINEKISPEDKKILEMMETSIHKFKKTILDLTEITKAQKGYDDAQESLSLSKVLDEVTSDLQIMIKESKAVINTNFEVKEVFYSPHNLRSIFYNLISNAIKYRSPERRVVINISSKKSNEYIQLTFSDNGLGINEQHKPKLFTMFKRFHTHVDGTGIGLYVIKRILENNQGKIELVDTDEAGTTFNVFIKQKAFKPIK